MPKVFICPLRGAIRLRLQSIKISPHVSGNRIELMWQYPEGADYTAVRVVRGESTYPVAPDEGVVVDEGEGLWQVSDSPLKAETFYYYTLFPYKNDPPEYVFERRNRASAMATGPYGMAETMYALLPFIYHRYDSKLPEPGSVSAEDENKGELRRFIDVPAGLLDQFYSYAKGVKHLQTVQHSPGALLPLLAQWIAWNTDTFLEIAQQRNEIRNAPAVYKAVGLMPVVNATVKRISGWDSRIKEFVYNVCLTNGPERLNVWWQTSPDGSDWSLAAELLSLDYAFEGAPSLWLDGNQLWFFYHTQRNGQWDIWFKTADVTTGEWVPSKRFTKRAMIDKQPSIARAQETFWVFWAGSQSDHGPHGIYYRTSVADGWEKEIAAFEHNTSHSQSPRAVTIDDRVWLFWMDKRHKGWQLRYARHDGAWAAPVDFPLDGGNDPIVETDLFAVFQPPPGAPRLFVFWSRRTLNASGEQRWEIVYRVKTNVNVDASGWSNVRQLPAPPAAAYHDREPFAFINGSGELECYWSSNQGDGGWKIRRATMTAFDADLVAGADTWSAASQVSQGLYNHRNPCVLVVGAGRWLMMRSNEQLIRRSRLYRATDSVDERYAGSTLLDTRNLDKIQLRESYDDFQTYTFDTGTNNKRDNGDWYGRDTIGVYLDNEILDEDAVQHSVDRLAPVVEEFMPLTDRAVYVPRQFTHTEYVYTYGRPISPETRRIVESYMDQLNSELLEPVFGPSGSFSDEVS